MNPLLKNTIIYALGDILPKALSLILFPILTSYLSLADYGIVNFVNTVVFFLSTIGFLCLNTYYLVYYYRIGGEIEQRKLLGNLSIFIIGLNLLISISLFTIGFFLPSFFSSKINFYPYLALGVGTNFFNILSVLPSALYRVQERPLPLTILNVSRGVLTMLLTVILVVHYGFSALGVLWSTFSISALFGIIFLQLTIKNMTWNFDWQLIIRALRFSIPLIPGSVAYYFLSMADRLFIERYLTLSDLGTYSSASTLALITNIIAYGAYKAFEPHIFKIYGQADFADRFLKIQNLFLFSILFVGMGLSIFSKEFFQIFSGRQYQSVYYYVPLIECGVVLSSFGMLYSTVVVARERTKINSLVIIAGGVISVLINVTMLPRIGLVAACLASTSAFGLMLAMSVYFAGVHLSLTRPLLSWLVAITTVIIAVYILEISNIWVSIGVKLILLALAIILICSLLRLTPMKLFSMVKKDHKSE